MSRRHVTVASKAEAIALVEETWRELDARIDRASETELMSPVFSGEGEGWRLRDMLPHFAFWWRLAARGARRAIETGSAPDQSTTLRAFVGVTTHFDDLNAENHATWKDRPIAELRREFRDAREELRAALDALPEALLLSGDRDTDGMRRYLWQAAVNHPRQHASHIDSAIKEGVTT